MEAPVEESVIPGGEVILPENGSADPEVVDKGALSPLTGSYLLILLAEPHSQEDREIILQRLNKGLLAWDVDSSHVDLNCELLNLTNSCPEGDEARNGEKLIQWASENLVVEVLIHSQVNTLQQCMKNLLASFTRHRHIIHAGYTFQGSGSWILQDGTFSLSDYLELWGETEVQRILSAYKGDIRVSMHCASEGGWTQDRFDKEHFSKLCQITMNAQDKPSPLLPHSAGVTSFVEYISKMLIPSPLKEILEPSEIVGNIRFSHPTLYVFPGGQGDAALFGINGFNMLIDGGFARKACFWDFTRHLDRLDAVLLTRMNTNAVGGLGAVIQRKMMNQVYPQIGHFFGNVMERRHSKLPALPSSSLTDTGDHAAPDGGDGEAGGENGGDSTESREKLLISLQDEGQRIFENLRSINLKPHLCFRENVIEPINLYHKVGHGKLDLYILNPAKDSREVKEFLTRWHTEKTSNTTASKVTLKSSNADGKDFQFPVLNLVSICALLVWQPANPRDSITRILFPGSTPQHKIFEALQKLKHLEFLKYPVCSAKTIAASNRSKLKSEKILSEAKHQLTKTTEARALSSHPISKTQSSAGLVTSRSISTSRAPPAASSTFISREKRGEESSNARDSKDQSKESKEPKEPKEDGGSKAERSTSRRLHQSASSKTITEKAEKAPTESKKPATKSARSTSSTVSRTSSASRVSSNKAPQSNTGSSLTSKQISPTSPTTKQHKPESKLKRPQSSIIAAHNKSNETPPLTPPKTVKDAAASRRVIEYKAKVKAASAKTDSGNKTSGPLASKQASDSKKRLPSSTTTRPSSIPTSAAPPSHKSPPPHGKRSISSASAVGKKQPPKTKDTSKSGSDAVLSKAAVAAATAAAVVAASSKIPSPTEKEPVNGKTEPEEPSEEHIPAPDTNGNGPHHANGEPETETEEQQEDGGEEIEEDEYIKQSQDDEQPLSLPSSIYPPLESGSELSSLDHISITEEDEPMQTSHHSTLSVSKETEFQDETTAATETIQGLESEHEGEEEEYLIVEKDELTDNESKQQQSSEPGQQNPPDEDRAATPLVTDPHAEELEVDAEEGEQTPEIGQSPKQSIISSPAQDIKPVQPIKDELIISTHNETLTKNPPQTTATSLGLSQLPDEPEVGRSPQDFEPSEETKSLEHPTDFLHGLQQSPSGEDEHGLRKVSSETEIPLEKVESLHNVPTSLAPGNEEAETQEEANLTEKADVTEPQLSPEPTLATQEQSLPSDQDTRHSEILEQFTENDLQPSHIPQESTKPDQIPGESSKEKAHPSESISHQTLQEKTEQQIDEAIIENPPASQNRESTLNELQSESSVLQESPIKISQAHQNQLSSSQAQDAIETSQIPEPSEPESLSNKTPDTEAASAGAASGSNIDQIQFQLPDSSESQGADDEVLVSAQSTQNVIPEEEPPQPQSTSATQSSIDSIKPEETPAQSLKDTPCAHQPSDDPPTQSMQIQSDSFTDLKSPQPEPEESSEEKVPEQNGPEGEDAQAESSDQFLQSPEKASKDDGTTGESQDKDQIQEQVSSIIEHPLQLSPSVKEESTEESNLDLHQTEHGDNILQRTPRSLDIRASQEEDKAKTHKYEQISEKDLNESPLNLEAPDSKEEDIAESEVTPQPTTTPSSLRDELESTQDLEKITKIEKSPALQTEDTLEEASSLAPEPQETIPDLTASSQTLPDNKDDSTVERESSKDLTANQPGNLPSAPLLQSKDTMDDASSLSLETLPAETETEATKIPSSVQVESVTDKNLDEPEDSIQNKVSEQAQVSAPKEDESDKPESEPSTKETTLEEASETSKSVDNISSTDAEILENSAIKDSQQVAMETIAIDSEKLSGEIETPKPQTEQETESAQAKILEPTQEKSDIQKPVEEPEDAGGEEGAKPRIPASTSELSQIGQRNIEPSSQESQTVVSDVKDELSPSKELGLSQEEEGAVTEESGITQDSKLEKPQPVKDEKITSEKEPQEISVDAAESSDLQDALSAAKQSDAQDNSIRPQSDDGKSSETQVEDDEIAPGELQTDSQVKSPQLEISNKSNETEQLSPATGDKPKPSDQFQDETQNVLVTDEEEKAADKQYLATEASDKLPLQESDLTDNLKSAQAEPLLKSETSAVKQSDETSDQQESAPTESVSTVASSVEDETSAPESKEVKESSTALLKSETEVTGEKANEEPTSSSSEILATETVPESSKPEEKLKIDEISSSKADSPAKFAESVDEHTPFGYSHPSEEVIEETIIPTKVESKHSELKESFETSVPEESDGATVAVAKSPASEQEAVKDESTVPAETEFESPASIDEVKGSSSSAFKLDEILEPLKPSDSKEFLAGDQKTAEDIKSGSEESRTSMLSPPADFLHEETVPDATPSPTPSEIHTTQEVQEDVIVPVKVEMMKQSHKPEIEKETISSPETVTPPPQLTQTASSSSAIKQEQDREPVSGETEQVRDQTIELTKTESNEQDTKTAQSPSAVVEHLEDEHDIPQDKAMTSTEIQHTTKESTSVPLKDEEKLQDAHDEYLSKESISGVDLAISTKEEPIELSHGIESGEIVTETRELSSAKKSEIREPSESSSDQRSDSPTESSLQPETASAAPVTAVKASPQTAYESQPLTLDIEETESESRQSGASEPEKLLSHATEHETLGSSKDLESAGESTQSAKLFQPEEAPAPQAEPTRTDSPPSHSAIISSQPPLEKVPLSPIPPQEEKDSILSSLEKEILEPATNVQQQLSSPRSEINDIHPAEVFEPLNSVKLSPSHDASSEKVSQQEVAEKPHTSQPDTLRKLSIEMPQLTQDSGEEESLESALEKASQEITSTDKAVEQTESQEKESSTKAPVEPQLSPASQDQLSRLPLDKNADSTPISANTAPAIPDQLTGPQSLQTDSSPSSLHQSSLDPETSSELPDSAPASAPQQDSLPQGFRTESKEINQQIPSQTSSSQLTQSELRDMSKDISSQIYEISSQTEIQPVSTLAPGEIPDKTEKSLGQEEKVFDGDTTKSQTLEPTSEIIRDVQQLSPATIEASIDKLHTEIDQVIDNAESAMASPAKGDQLSDPADSEVASKAELEATGESIATTAESNAAGVSIATEIAAEDKRSESETAESEIIQAMGQMKISETTAESTSIEAISEFKEAEITRVSKTLETSSGSKTIEAATEFKTLEAASESKTIDVVSESKIVETATESKTVEAASESKTVEAASESKTVEAASESEIFETATESKTLEAATETKLIDVISESKTFEAASESKTLEASSESKTVEASSESKILEASSESKTLEASSESKIVETSSGSKILETAAESKTVEASSESKTLETASEYKTLEASSESKPLETAAETIETASDSKTKSSTSSAIETSTESALLAKDSNSSLPPASTTEKAQETSQQQLSEPLSPSLPNPSESLKNTEIETIPATATTITTIASSVSGTAIPPTTPSPTHSDSRESREIMKEFIATSDVMVAVKDGMEKLVLKQDEHLLADLPPELEPQLPEPPTDTTTAILPTADDVYHDCVEVDNLSGLPPVDDLLKVIEDVEPELLLVEDTKFIRPLPYEESLTTQEGIEHLLRESRAIVDKEQKADKKIKEDEERIPSAIPSKLPRESREVIRTPDEVADLPVHEEVEPGTYELDELINDSPQTHDTRHSPPPQSQTPLIQPLPAAPSLDSSTKPQDDNLPADLNILPEVTKIDAAVSPVLESLLGQVKSFPPSSDPDDPEEQLAEQSPAAAAAIQKSSSAPVEPLNLAPITIPSSDVKKDSELQATSTTSVVITPSTPPVQIVEKSEFHYTAATPLETDVAVSESIPATTTVQVESQDGATTASIPSQETLEESKPELVSLTDAGTKTSPLSLPSHGDGERKLSASDESSTSSATPLTAVSKEKDAPKSEDVLQESTTTPSAPQPQKLFSLPGHGDEDDEEDESQSGNSGNSGEDVHIPGSESPLGMGAIRSGLLTAATTLSAALISQSPEQLASLQSSPTHEAEGAAPEITSVHPVSSSSHPAPANDDDQNTISAPQMSHQSSSPASPPTSPPASQNSALSLSIDQKTESHQISQDKLSSASLEPASLKTISKDTDPVPDSPSLLTPEQVVSAVIAEAGEQVVQETAKLAQQILDQVEEKIQSSSSIFSSQSSSVEPLESFSTSSSRHHAFTSSKEQTEKLISSLSNTDDFFSSSSSTFDQISTIDFPQNLNISHPLHNSTAQKEQENSNIPQEQIQDETLFSKSFSSSQSKSSSTKTQQPDILSTSSKIIQESRGESSQDSPFQSEQTKPFSTTSSIISRDATLADSGISSVSSISSGQTTSSTTSSMHQEKLAFSSSPSAASESKKQDDTRELETSTGESAKSCTHKSEFIESSGKETGQTSPSSSTFSTFSAFTPSSFLESAVDSANLGQFSQLKDALVSKQVTQISTEHQKLLETQKEQIQTFSSSSSFFTSSSSSKRDIDQVLQSVETESVYMLPGTKSTFSADSGPQSSFAIGKQSSAFHDPKTLSSADKTQIELEIEQESSKQTTLHYTQSDKYIPPGFHPSQHELMDEGSYSSGDFSDSQLSTVAGGKDTLLPDEDNYNFYHRETVSGISQDFENGNFPTTATFTSAPPSTGSATHMTTTTRLITTTAAPENANFTAITTANMISSALSSSIQTGSTTTSSSNDQDNKPTSVTSGSSFMSTHEFSSTSAPSSSSRQKEAEGDDILKTWGKPLGLPPVAADPSEPLPEDQPTSQPEQQQQPTQVTSTAPEQNPKTPKKDKSLDRGGSSSRNAAGTPAKSHSSRTGRSHHRSTKHVNPVYLDLAYVPHHGNSNYCDSEFFRLVRARYYVFSGLEPSRQVFDGLLQGKQQWDDKNLEVTIIPTYDTDTLGYWVVDSEDALADAHIDLAPSASRCTINLQDHETSCAAYRLEF